MQQVSNTDVLRFDLSPTQGDFVFSTAVVNCLYSNTGEGKCLRKGSNIIMFDGSIRAVEDIMVGDRLMGEDSRPRTVLSLARGREDMVEVIPTKGEPFAVNKSHILSLKKTGTSLSPKGKKIDISVADYLEKDKAFRYQHKLYRVGIDFPSRPHGGDPYLLGLWLGDGTSSAPHITTSDHEVVDFLETYANRAGTTIRVVGSRGRAKLYAIGTGDTKNQDNFSGTCRNPFRLFLLAHDLLRNKHIPEIFKSNDRSTRLQLLAGIIDSDGWKNHEGYQVIQKSYRLATDIAFVARSLGFAAYVKKRTKSIRSTGFSGEYYHIMISGDCSIIPVRIARKKCSPRKQKRDVLVSGIKEIRPVGIDDYYGFTLDGNGRFLLEDFTVTHNSYAGVIAMLVHAQRNKKPIYAAIVRDTHENIKISTVRTIQETFDICEFPRRLYQFKNDFKELHIKSDPGVMVDLMGIDDPSSYSKLQGPQYALIWLEEPAPIVDRSNAGLAEDVFNLALVRCARQKNCIPRLQVTMNPAEDTHWTHRRLIEDPEVDPDYPLITKKVFRLFPGENKHVSEVSRQAVKSAYKNDPASWARYVAGEFAPSYRGKKVTPEYNPENFRSKDILEPARGLIGFRGWDGWHLPACVLGQITMSGRLVFLDTIKSEEVTDVRQLSAAKVIPLLNSPRWKDKCKEWRDIGDISMATPDQSTRQESAARVIENLFGTIFEPGPAKWMHMKLGVHNAFTTNIDGRTSFILNPSERHIHRALSGDWHYPTDNSGNITSKVPAKLDSSHVGDAWANVVNVLLGTYGKVRVTPEKLKSLRERQKNIAASY